MTATQLGRLYATLIADLPSMEKQAEAISIASMLSIAQSEEWKQLQSAQARHKESMRAMADTLSIVKGLAKNAADAEEKRS